ncbi:MAG: recombinase family protein [Oscillospiraceae bacterium]|nr:recombinase family protein [Oscillospiraceae bacterium]
MRRIDEIKKEGIMPTAAIYARFSSDMQREESIDAQLRACRQYADINGIHIVAEYIDRAKSATTTDNREEFNRMLADADNFDFVIVHKLDRFARNRKDSICSRMDLKKHNTTVISVMEQFDDSSPESVILESVLEGMNEYYSLNLAREVRKGLHENALKCKHTGGLAPLGYDVNPITKQLELNESEAQAVKLIFQSVLNGVGYTNILHLLNEKGFKTKRGNSFGKNSLYDILRNEKYTGTYVYNLSESKDNRQKRNSHKHKDDSEVIRIENGIPQIIDPDTFTKVQAILDDRRNKTSSAKAHEVYLLSGKIRCGECGAIYCGNRHNTGARKLPLVTYRCNNRTSRTSKICKNKEINKIYLEKFVLNILTDIIFDNQYIPNIVSNYNEHLRNNSQSIHAEHKRISIQLAALENRIDKLTDIIAETGNIILVKKLDEYAAEQEKLKSQLSDTENRMSEIFVSDKIIADAFARAKLLFQSGQLNETKQLINLYVKEIVVYPDTITVTINPSMFLTSVIPSADRKQINRIPEQEFNIERTIERCVLNRNGQTDNL